LINVSLLSVFGAAAYEHNDLNTILCQINPLACAVINFVFTNATDPLNTGQISLLHPVL
jgi:hypothetical protein